MGLKRLRLESKVALAGKIYIPPFTRLNMHGNVEHVDGYWRTGVTYRDLTPEERKSVDRTGTGGVGALLKPKPRLTPAQQAHVDRPFDSDPGYTRATGVGKGSLHEHVKTDHSVPDRTADSNLLRITDLHSEQHAADKRRGKDRHAERPTVTVDLHEELVR